MTSPTLTAGVNAGTINNGNGQVTITWTAPAATAGVRPASLQSQPVTVPASLPGMLLPAAAAPGSVIATVPVGAVPQGVAVDSSSRTAYVTNYAAASLSVIDEASNTVIATLPLPTNGSPFGVAADPSRHTVYVTNSGLSTVSVIDGVTNTVTATIPSGAGGAPYGVGVDPSRHAVYVANLFANSIAVIDETSNAVTATSRSVPTHWD